MVACCRGFVDIVPLLRLCPHVDVNQQDTEGNTALMMAAQAGGHREPGVAEDPSFNTSKVFLSLLLRARHHR